MAGSVEAEWVDPRKEEEARFSKEKLRRLALKRRGQMDEETRKRASLLMTERLVGHQWFYLADELLIFASFGTEIETWEVIEEALRKKKAVYLPKVCGKEMRFYRIFQKLDLRPGYRGIPEPDPSAPEYVYNKDCQSTLLVMPGVAFDPFGNRIGYGGGFYDRFLADKPSLQQKSIAVGFRCQMVERIPQTPWDMKPCQVLTF